MISQDRAGTAEGSGRTVHGGDVVRGQNGLGGLPLGDVEDGDDAPRPQHIGDGRQGGQAL